MDDHDPLLRGRSGFDSRRRGERLVGTQRAGLRHGLRISLEARRGVEDRRQVLKAEPAPTDHGRLAERRLQRVANPYSSRGAQVRVLHLPPRESSGQWRPTCLENRNGGAHVPGVRVLNFPLWGRLAPLRRGKWCRPPPPVKHTAGATAAGAARHLERPSPGRGYLAFTQEERVRPPHALRRASRSPNASTSGQAGGNWVVPPGSASCRHRLVEGQQVLSLSAGVRFPVAVQAAAQACRVGLLQ